MGKCIFIPVNKRLKNLLSFNINAPTILSLSKDRSICGPCWDRTNDPLIMSQVL